MERETGKKARTVDSLALPIALINGRSSKPRLTIIGGLHPTEYAGMEAAMRLAQSLQPGDVSVE